MNTFVVGSTAVTIPRVDVNLKNSTETFCLSVYPNAVMQSMKCYHDGNQLRIEYKLQLTVRVDRPFQPTEDAYGKIEVTGTTHYMRHRKDARTVLWLEDLSRPGFFDVSTVKDERLFIRPTSAAIPITQLHLIVTQIDQWRPEIINTIQSAITEMFAKPHSIIQMLVHDQS